MSVDAKTDAVAADLSTARLFLRPIRHGDEHLLWPDISDPEIPRYMSWHAHKDPSETARFVANELGRIMTGRGVTWLILNRSEAFCGIISLIGLIRRHRSLIYDRAELAYWLAGRCRGQGIMQEAIAAVVAYSFDTLKLHKVIVSHFSANQASENLIKRSGFRFIGEQVEEFNKDGTWHNHKCYELLDREYAARAKREQN
jgi:RimJ/RimL family protein N-acetyltransferase